MSHYLSQDFRPEYLEWVAAIHHPAYYVKIMVAWYFATALTKQYDLALPFIEQGKLETWTHNKAIQKACESRLIPLAHQEYLKSLKHRP